MSRPASIFLVRGFMRNYQIWNKHGDDSEKEPTEILMDTVEETIH